VTREEAAALAAGNSFSFLHISRSEIDLPPETDPHDPPVYAKARENFTRLRTDGAFLEEAAPCFYLYELTRDGHAQLGVVGCVHVDDYAGNVIRKHENTRQDKEDDRTRHILALNAHAEPVLVAYEGQPFIAQMNHKVTGDPPLYELTTPDKVRHRVWRVSDQSGYTDAFRRIAVAYVADGHHRCASALRAARERRAANPKDTGGEEYNWFPAVLFPSSQLQILPYNRVVRDLNGMTPADFLAALGRVGSVEPAAEPAPDRPASFGVFLDGRWYRVSLDPTSLPIDDAVAVLDVSLLQDRVLGPLLGIGDVRTDPRIEFVGGGKGIEEIERRVGSGEMAVGFTLNPVTVRQLITISDARGIMPPKSTWFEPKLLSGLFVHALDSAESGDSE
jgi:uncharacterized protein (DUF1015 family)